MRQYQYLILRYVQNVSTEEFVNIGILMWLPEERRFLHQISEKYSRLSSFFADFDGNGYRKMVRHLNSKLRAMGTQSLEQVRTIDELADAVFPRDPSCFQWSSAMAGVATNPEQRLDKIYRSIIERHFNKQERVRRDETHIYQDLVRRLQNRSLAERLQQNVSVEGQHFNYTFKLGWQNGTPQFLEPISFDYTKGAELVDKAYSWSGRLSDLGKGLNFKMTGIVAPPQDPNLLEKYEEALEILRESPAVRSIVPESEFDSFVPEIERDLSDHH